MDSVTEMLASVKNQLGAILNGRIENAGKLISAGAVTRLDDYNWTVQSQSAKGEYHVTFKMQWTCTCKDYIGDGFHPAPTVEFMGSVGPVCKHILASGFAWASGEYPSPKQSPLFDLVIATKKAPFVSGPDGRILWFKLAGQEKVEPAKTAHLTDGPIQAKLAKYALVHTEALAGMVIRRYNLNILTHEVQL